jgi:imidazolonepropionase-like amidohydrolase
MKNKLVLGLVFFVLSIGTFSILAQEATLIRNANIFDGSNETLKKGQSVLVEGNLIKKIGVHVKAPRGAQVIDAQGKTLMPGFIDAHAHLMFQMSIPETLNADPFYYGYVATQTAETYLMHGVTTVRDASGNCFSLKKAIDRGIVVGPRVFPSGPMISQTSGHSDHRTDAQVSAMIAYEPSTLMKYDMVQLADGVPEVLKATREALRRGASQIKISVGGGTGSFADPLDVTQYTDEEIQAAVEAAADWGTYVMSHVYNDKGAQRAIKNGVKSIEHGNLLSEETFRLMEEHDVWLSPQVLVYTYHPAGYTDDQKAKHDLAYSGIDAMFKAAKKTGFKNIAFGTDVITDPEKLKLINNEFELRTQWFESIEILRQATSYSARLLALSGNRNPYGKIGVIEEGAMADILLINGNPLQDIKILTKPQENLLLIMKDGKVYKNIL